MNRKTMPLILMLVAGAVTCVITYVKQYSVLNKLLALLAVLLIFYFLGTVLRWALDSFDKQNEQKDETAGDEEEPPEGEKEEGEKEEETK